MSFSQSQSQGNSRAPKNSSGGTSAGQWAGLGISALGTLFCSRTLKNHIDEVDVDATFTAIRQLPLAIWKYKDEFADDMERPDRAVHLGPYAEDFHQVLGLGDGRTISFIDMLGVAMAGIQGAANRITVLEGRVEELTEMIAPEIQAVVDPFLEEAS
jgi:hypothetical protein